MSLSESCESYKSHCLGLLSKYQEKERRRKKNWPLLDLSASPQVKRQVNSLLLRGWPHDPPHAHFFVVTESGQVWPMESRRAGAGGRTGNRGYRTYVVRCRARGGRGRRSIGHHASSTKRRGHELQGSTHVPRERHCPTAERDPAIQGESLALRCRCGDPTMISEEQEAANHSSSKM